MSLWFLCFPCRLFSVFVETLKRDKEQLCRRKRATTSTPKQGLLVGCSWTLYLKNSPPHLAIKSSSDFLVTEADVLGSLCQEQRDEKSIHAAS